MSSHSNIEAFERVLKVLTIIEFESIATTHDIHKCFPQLHLRTIQRYVKDLEEAGYIKKIVGDMCYADRLFLTEKAKRIVVKKAVKNG